MAPEKEHILTSAREEAVDWSRRRADLLRGLKNHLIVFLSVMVLLLLINWTTRGDHGAWWAVLPLEIWTIAWSLHLFGVGLAFSGRRREE